MPASAPCPVNRATWRGLFLGTPQTRASLFLMLGAVALTVFFQEYRDWDLVAAVPDSDSYIQGNTAASWRPPVYPLFIRCLADPDALLAERRQMPLNGTVDGAAFPLALRVVRGQKVVLAASLLFFVWGLGRFLPLPFGLVSGVLAATMLSPERGTILSEAFAQAATFCTAASFLAFMTGPRARWLVCASLMAAVGFLIRPACIYLYALPGVMVAWYAYAFRKKALALIMACAALSLLLALAPALLRYAQRGVFLVEPHQAASPMTFALYFAEAADIPFLPDEQSRTFLSTALEKRQSLLAELPPPQTPSDMSTIFDRMLYDIVFPLSSTLGYDVYTEKRLFKEIYPVVFERHFREIVRYRICAFHDALVMSTRQNQVISPLSGRIIDLPRGVCAYTFLLAIVVLCCLERSRYALIPLGLELMHLVHILVTVVYNVPTLRYIALTNVFSLAAFLISLFMIGKILATRLPSVCRAAKSGS